MGESEAKPPAQQPMLLKDQFSVVVRAIANIPSSVHIEVRLSALKLYREWLEVQAQSGVFGEAANGKKLVAEIIKKGMADTILEQYFGEGREKKKK